MSKRALFIDRDGVVNEDLHFVSSKDNFRFKEPIFEVCRIAQDFGFLIVIITNQSGIGRGYFSLHDFEALNRWMLEVFAGEGVLISAVYFCPHHPSEGLGEYGVECECRKPKPGMFLTAARDMGIDLQDSVAVGDRLSDLIASQRAGVGRNLLLVDPKTVDALELEEGAFVIHQLKEAVLFLSPNSLGE